METLRNAILPSRPLRAPAVQKRWIAAGVVIVTALIATLTGLSIYESRLQYEERVAVTTQNLTLLLEQSIGALLDKTDISLRAVKLVAESEIARGGIDEKSFAALLAQQQSNMPELEALRVTDADGIVRFGRGAAPMLYANPADRDFFARVRDEPAAGLVIDGPMVSRSTGKSVLVLARRIDRRDGTFGGAVYAIIPTTYFSSLFSTMDLGAHGAISLRTDRLGLVARYPGGQTAADVPGSRAVSAQLTAMVRASPRAGSYTAVTVLDRVERRNAYRKVAGYPFYVIVGLATADYLVEWRRHTLTILAMSLLLFAIVLTAATLVYGFWKRQLLARDALARESYRNQQFLRKASDGVHILDDKGNLLEMSDAFGAMLGYTREELIGSNISVWDVKRTAAELKEVIRRQMSALSYTLYETRHRRRDGSVIDVEIHGHPLKLDGRWVLLNSSRDITERKRASAEREQFTAIVQNSNDAIISRALDGAVISWNPAAEKLFGYTAAEAIGRDMTAVFSSGTEIEIAANRKLVSLGQSVANYETVRVARDGRRVDVSLSMFPLKDSDGVVIGTSAILRDDSERKRADEARARLAAIVEGANDAIIGRTLDGVVTSWNAAAGQMLGYTAAEAIGRDIVVTPADRQHESAENRTLLAAGTAIASYETVRVASDGRRIDVSLSASPVKDDHGTVIGTATILRDISERKRSEAAIEESELRFRAAFEQAAVGMAMRDIDPRKPKWLRVNQKFCDMLGYTRAELLELTSVDVTPPEDRDLATSNNELLMSGERSNVSREKRYLRKDGRIIWVNIYASAVSGPDGRRTHIMSVIDDITAHKRAEEARARLAAVVESSQDAIISRGLDGTILSWNAGAGELFGYTAAEAIGRKMTLIIPSERWPQFEYNQQMLREGRVQPAYDGINMAKDGRRIPVSISVSPVRSSNGTITHAAIVIRDITAAKRAEAQLRLAASVFDTAAEGIIITDQHNKAIVVNAAFTHITGYEAHEVIGKYPRLHYAGRQARHVYGEMWAAVKASGHWQGEVWDRRKNGELYCELLSVSAIRNEAGEVVQHCAILMDITRRKTAEEELQRLNDELENRVAGRTRELERANRELDAFSYSVSHDLRAPLRAISGFGTLALRTADAKRDQQMYEYLEKMRAGAERMGTLIDDLLRLSRISRQQMRWQEFDLSQVAAEIGAALRVASPDRVVEFSVAPGMRANGDRSLLRIALDNVIGNAWKFTATRTPAKIEMGAAVRDGETVYYVRDNGAGFNMEYSHKLFNAFQRLHGSDEFEGTGIGLSIVNRIVLRHGGRVWGDGKTGEGATFYFTLGRSAADADEDSAPPAGAAVH